ncbi:germin-like protein 9-3 [Corylus avellana]|uniref:germin-like protein 9-3 n=1 Tax=Corylus avellana TaxID=13451 RepID=UPI00286CD39E|nr:germin-like protein 9-3 [Corylus avellana]
MASKTLSMKLLFSLLISSFAIMIRMATAGDPDILFDFVASPNVTVDGNFFKFTGMRSLIGAGPPTAFKASKASMAEFPVLNGQSISMDVLEFPAGSISPPHTRVRATGLLLLVACTLEVGFVDTTNKLFSQILQTGDMFIFPKGLVHFPYNAGSTPAIAIAAFGSANAGLVSLPNTLFNTSIDDNVLALSFKTDVATIQRLKAALTPKPRGYCSMVFNLCLLSFLYLFIYLFLFFWNNYPSCLEG